MARGAPNKVRPPGPPALRSKPADPPGILMRMPLFLQIWGIFSASMFVPAAYALVRDNHPHSQSFFYSGLLGLVIVTLIALALAARPPRFGAAGQLLALLGTFALLPLFLAVPLHDALRTTSFFNAYFDMVSAITTTGADIFADPRRLEPPLHLWRAQVAWMGGLVMWIAASAILAPMSLGGFEITARGQPGRGVVAPQPGDRTDRRRRLWIVARTLTPIYAGLTGVVWVLLLVAGETGLTALVHAMSVMSTSGISPVGGVHHGQAGLGGEVVLFLFMAFALSRLTFSSDTATSGHGRLDRDPEFRIGLLLVLGVPLLMFLRHWSGAYDVDAGDNLDQALRAFWGSMFTVMSYVSTTGFLSTEWDTAQHWSGLGTPGLILM
ncbi:MAG TPA: potassium transporter TrkH, partial [Rhodobacteraceae bacterium]|nr:potassium transporter TrkH [Paracoccaceae bacterium]